jgi:outer membrane usher protein FimD/PapC
MRRLLAMSACLLLLPQQPLAQIHNLLDSQALERVRAYSARINGSHSKDLLLIADDNNRLYFPMTELADYIDTANALLLAENIYGCTPCIPLDAIADTEFDELKNQLELTIHPAFLPPQRFGRASIGSDATLSYGGGLATNINLLSRYDERRDVEQYAADLDVGVSLGRGGNVYSSQLYLSEGDSIRGQSYYEKAFERSKIRLQIGDTNTRPDTFGGALQIGGIRLSRAFDVAPDYRYRPIFKYQTEAKLPGTLELFIDGQRIKNEEYQQGQLQVESDAYGSGQELTLILTDALGNRRVIRQSLFDASQNLAPGVVDFDISYGAIRDTPDKYQDEYAAGYISTGISNHWTQSLSYQGNEEFELASTEFILAAGNHHLSVEPAWSHIAATTSEGNAVTARYAYDWDGKTRWVTLGAEYFSADNFAQFRGRTLSGDGGTVSLSTGTAQLYYGVSAFEIGDLSGGSFNFGYNRRGWYLESNAEYLETGDYIAILSIGYRPQQRHAPRVRVAHSWERDQRSVGADVTGNISAGQSQLGYQLAAAQDYESQATLDSRAGLSYRDNYITAQANYDDVNRFYRSSSRVSTGFVISKHNSFITPLPVSQAYATARTGQKGVVISSASTKRKTYGNGAASVPVPAYYPTTVKIERDSLASSDVLTTRQAPVRVAKANYASVDMPVTQAPIIIHILHNGISDILINGKPFVHNDFGAYITKYRPNASNTLEVGGKRYKLHIPLVTEELPIYEFDRTTGEMTRASELFRSYP